MAPPPPATAAPRPSEPITDPLTELALAAAHDRAALSAFIRLTQADVWRFLARLTDPATADDLTQETYLRVLQALPAFAARSSARTWLLAIARRVVVDSYRHDEARPRLSGDRIPDVAAASDDPAGHFAVIDLLAGLSDSRREALVLTALMGFSYAEAAQICDCRIGTIRSRVARARADLVTFLTRDPLRAVPG